MKYILAGTRFVLMVFFLAVYYGGYRISLLWRKHTVQRGFYLRQTVLNTLNPIMGFRIDVSGQPVKSPALYVCNHRGLLDFFVTLRYIDAFVVSKAEMKNMPIIGPGAVHSGVIFVQRDDKNSRRATRQAISDTLLQGQNVLLFPEGTTNIKQTTAEFHTGAFQELAGTGIPVIPMALEYRTKRDYWKNISIREMFVQQFGKWNTHCRLRFGPPLYSEDGLELASQAREWIDRSLIEMQSGWSNIVFANGDPVLAD